MQVLRGWVASGQAGLIEHNMEVIKTADWIIDMGPQGGDLGGEIIAACTPEELIEKEKSLTGKFLKDWL